MSIYIKKTSERGELINFIFYEYQGDKSISAANFDINKKGVLNISSVYLTVNNDQMKTSIKKQIQKIYIEKIFDIKSFKIGEKILIC